MSTPISLAELQRAGVALRAEEALAIAQKLIHEPLHCPLTAPLGPPAADNVFVDEEGSVACSGCESTPTVTEVAILLQTLLPEGAPNVSGPLRYTVARALHEVDAPPFDSLDALSAALARHERGERDRVIRALVVRSAAKAEPAARRAERRRGGRAADHRRHLREADERLYLQKLALDAALPPAKPAPGRRTLLHVGLALFLGLLGVAAAHAMRVASPQPPPAPPPPAWTQVSAAPAVPPRTPPRAKAKPRVLLPPAVRPARFSASTRPTVRRRVPILFSRFRIVDDFHGRE
ncbi:MAG TPA: hypothetical protein VEU08_15100 [Vicinamibacterales bacterium]|nr:hypothetical protein [Vicinamibacterales bacterium]